MSLISKIEIKGFRSIRSNAVSGLSNFTAFAGLNNSGKSNVLRALNAFFNGQTDIGEELNVDDDYYRPDLKMKKAKEISVTIYFELPENFRFRTGLEIVEALLGTRSFHIEKKWRRQTPLPSYFLNGDELSHDDRLKIDQFLQLINFRYIPNRVLPVDIIRDEHQALRDILVRRLGRRAGEHEAAFSAIRETSEIMIQTLVQRLTEASPDVGAVRLATPTSWSDMAFTFGYRLGHGDFEMTDAVQGSGIQSLLMLETLYLIDRDYFQKFGWRQAAIWAVEEPESSLHTSLEARVASFLSSIAADPDSRLQVLCTTHSDLMIQYSAAAVLVRKENMETVCELATSPHDALEQMSRAGISRWVHPILHYPADPLVLVEGKHDAAFLEEAFRLSRPNRRPRITYLEQISDGGATGGVDNLKKYVLHNARAIKARSKEAPVVIVLDWDAAGKATGFRRPFNDSDPISVLVWPDTAFNPNLNQTFCGIERHFSDRMINEAEKRGAHIFRDGNGVCSVPRQDYGQVKDILHKIVREGLQDDDLQFSRDFVRDVIGGFGRRA
jgi:predicted ATPase